MGSDVHRRELSQLAELLAVRYRGRRICMRPGCWAGAERAGFARPFQSAPTRTSMRAGGDSSSHCAAVEAARTTAASDSEPEHGATVQVTACIAKHIPTPIKD